MFPDFQKPFTLSTDASSNGLAYILEQKDNSEKRRPVCYGGRTLKGAERDYSAIELEGLCVLVGVKYYYHYLNNGKTFNIQTDNRALKYIFDKKPSKNPKLKRYALELQGLSYEVEHVPGKQHGHVDAISRWPDKWLLEAEKLQEMD